MTKRTISMACLVLAAALFCLHITAPDADAARFGSGKSFGGNASYSRTAPAPRPAQQQSYANRQTQAQNPAAAAGMGSGFRGMMGGLLAGSLLGALLFGGPHTGFGTMDMLLIALVSFMALKLLRFFMSRRAAENVVDGGNARMAENVAQPQTPWQHLQGSPSSTLHTTEGADIRLAEFDQGDFLRGAKILYTRLQESWDKRDVDDIATFTTQAILNEVKAQAQADPAPSQTEILLVNASLVSAVREGKDDVASVFFDVLLRENQDADTPSQIRELWHFIRPSGSTQSWRLDGIQQVE